MKPIVKVNENVVLDLEDLTNIINKCPRKVYSIEDEKLKVINEDACIFCNACVNINNKAVTVVPDETYFIFTVETTSALTATEVVLKAIRHLRKIILTAREETIKIKIKCMALKYQNHNNPTS